ncbi:hypothetical protein [Methylovirgula sp. HY1]|uniref:hypothetical protein n=1 Tax=Methylovirgula sp. HY1 TaxID=2822761 RepID=UPI001C5AEFA2|nr:hypothetical protein [Methylovirgula sp. HY1]QXX74275.1 hypothetical protein MHY1_01085 [Methylovirgula sp. HY1]
MIRNGAGPTSVLQPWTFNLSFMQQTVLLTAVRGPDGLPKYGGVKMLLRWYRRCILVSSLDGEVLENPCDPRGGSFMGPSYQPRVYGDVIGISVDGPWQNRMDDILSEYLRELDAVPHHFQLHLLHSFEIVGYKHPTFDIQSWFQRAYFRLVNDMHLWPETEEQLDERLNDTRVGWLKRADPATVA